MTHLSLTNGTFVSLLPEVAVECGDVIVKDGIIQAFGPRVAASEPNAIDCEGALVLPGLVNAHTHLYSALAVGMPAPSVAPTNFLEILERVWWKLDRALDQQSLELSALIGGIEAARSGVTVLFDHHASPNFIDGSLDVVATALDQVGIRGVLCYEVTDRGGIEKQTAGVTENKTFIEKWEGQTSPSFRGLVGGHASFTLSDDTLRQLSAVCKQTGRGFHIHVAEDKADIEGCDPIERYEVAGLLGPDTILAHGVHLTPEALDVAAASQCWLIHNARSNMNNAVGYAKLASNYPKLALGTDGIGSDMISEVRTAFFKARDEHINDAWSLPVRLLQGGLQLAEQHLGIPMGRFEPGAAADMILTDYRLNTVVTADNFAGHLVFGFDRSHFKTVWARGKQIWPTTLDETSLAQRARAAAMSLWQRMEVL